MNIQRLEDYVNWLTERDWGWWPVVFLRPPKDKDIDNTVLLKITSFFGIILGLLLVVLRFIVFHSLTALSIAFDLVLGCVAFFLPYKFTFAYFWNRRARRLRGQRPDHERIV